MARAKIMLSKNVVCTDSFTELSPTAQALYIQANFEGDADGRITGIRRLLRSLGVEERHLEELIEAGLILECDGSYYITHYWINNRQDKSNMRGVGTSPEIQNGRIEFEGVAYKSAYVISNTEKSSESLSKDSAKAGNDIGSCNDTCNYSCHSKSEDNGNESYKGQGKTKSTVLVEARCPCCGGPSILTDSGAFDCPKCGSVSVDADGCYSKRSW